MRNHVLLAAVLCLSAPAAAADRNYGVSGFDRVRLDGDYRVTLTTGVAPFAKASGDARAIDMVEIKVDGRTLVIRSNRSAGWGGYPSQGGGPVTISVGTHDLTAVSVNGGGAMTVNRVEGLKFDAAAHGAGALTIDEVAVDQLSVGLVGASSIRLTGQSGKATFLIRGSSVAEAEGLSVKNAVIGAEGPAIVKLTATETAKVTAAGVGSVTLSGNPSCTLTIRGSAGVTGCKEQSR